VPVAQSAVRAALPSDVEEIQRIQASTWRTAYADLVPMAAIERLTGGPAREAWLAAVQAGPGHHVLVATEGSWTVGFCAAAAVDGSGEIGTLLVEPRWGRRGHGGRLLAAAASRLLADGASTGFAWVPAADQVSQRFYAAAGWEPNGGVRVLDAGGRELRELRLTGPLDLRAT
jgi:GNAT superfamily N-acetyltransferase